MRARRPSCSTRPTGRCTWPSGPGATAWSRSRERRRRRLDTGSAIAARPAPLQPPGAALPSSTKKRTGAPADGCRPRPPKGDLMGFIVAGVIVIIIIVILAMGIRIIRPTHRGLVERLGKYNHYCNPGLHIIIPIIERLFQIDVREVLVEAQPQTIITNDNLNAKVDAQVYLKVKADEENVKASQYNVTNYENQIVNLARTTLRNIIGTLTLKSANSERGKINSELRSTLLSETANWGIEILRTELKEIDPPEDVQETMNKVVKAENEKVAAIDFATATETQADGQRRAEIKKAEGT